MATYEIDCAGVCHSASLYPLVLKEARKYILVKSEAVLA